MCGCCVGGGGGGVGGNQVIESRCEGIFDCCIGMWHGLAR